MGNHFGSVLSYDGNKLNEEQANELYENYNNLAKLIRS